MTPGEAAWILSFQLSPIVLTNGIAQNLPGGALPIIAITESVDFVSGLLSTGGPPNLDDFFANFAPMPGSTIGENQFGNYPFANQSVAANAAITQPLTISMLMTCPARKAGGYATALATTMLLTTMLNQHDASGGTYTIITPKYFYTNCVRTRMVDASTSQSHQAQNAYQIDFWQPLLTLQQAQAAQNSLMSKLTGGTQIDGQPSWSGAAATTGSPSSLAGSAIPAGSATAGTNTAAPLTETLST